jgi:hypothetical protein
VPRKKNAQGRNEAARYLASLRNYKEDGMAEGSLGSRKKAGNYMILYVIIS